MKLFSCLCVLASAVAAGSLVQAQNVDLVTLPNRDTVQLTIYNSEDLTLVKEMRSITLKKGINRLQFSWAGTLIDPTSVQLRPLTHAEEVEVLDTVFLGQKPQSLQWNLESEFEGQARVEVTYFTSGLTWRMDYVAVANPEETELSLQGHVRVFNNSGEQYENAEVRLIVGKINLVEKIAELARRSGVAPPSPDDADYDEARSRAALRFFYQADKSGPATSEAPATGAREIIKEGVSEYFMFHVEGRESIPNGWSKRMPAVHADQAEFDIVYRMRAYQYGDRPVRFFILRNDEAHSLGDSPLPDGVIRVFRKNDNDGLSYLGQQQLNYVPVAAEIEVNLGPDDLVVFEQRKTATRRTDFTFDHFNKVVQGWNEHQSWQGTLRNYRDKPIDFELRSQFAGDVELKAGAPTSSFDFNTVETKLRANSRDKSAFPYTVTIHHGRNAKQNRVRLMTAE